MDITELHDEENLLVQMQDRWENYGSLDGIADTHDPFDCPADGDNAENRPETARRYSRETASP